MLTFSGVGLLVLAIAAALAAAFRLVDLIPFEVLAADGEAGTSVVGVVEAPGSDEMTLEPGRYAVWLVRSADQAPTAFAGELSVRGPDGGEVDVRSGPSVTGSVERGGRDAHTVAGFTADEYGSYRVEVPPQGDGRATVVVVPDTGLPVFLTGLAGTIGLGFLSALLGVVGIGLVIGGAVAWSRSARSAPRTVSR